MTRTSNDEVLSTESGICKMDTARAGGYRMQVQIDKQFPKSVYSTLLLNLDVFASDKILLSLYEGYLKEDGFHLYHYPGNFQLYKDED